jgi:hypothetical protein
MSVKVGHSTPSLQVAEIEQSIRFCELLGFAAIDTDRTKPLGWARMHFEGGAILFVRAEEPVDASKQSIILYMYASDLPGLRAHLLASGVKLPEIAYPHCMPSGEICISDPKRYIILVGHWGSAEQEGWEKRIGGKAEQIRIASAGGEAS